MEQRTEFFGEFVADNMHDDPDVPERQRFHAALPDELETLFDAVRKISEGNVDLLTAEERRFLEFEPINPAYLDTLPELRSQPLAVAQRVFQAFLEALTPEHEYYEDAAYQVDRTTELINEFYQLAILYRDRGPGRVP